MIHFFWRTILGTIHATVHTAVAHQVFILRLFSQFQKGDYCVQCYISRFSASPPWRCCSGCRSWLSWMKGQPTWLFSLSCVWLGPFTYVSYWYGQSRIGSPVLSGTNRLSWPRVRYGLNFNFNQPNAKVINVNSLVQIDRQEANFQVSTQQLVGHEHKEAMYNVEVTRTLNQY
jgi:hypothetical protein